MIEIEHNTIDLINENLKLKEILNFWSSNYAHDFAEVENKLLETENELKNYKNKNLEYEK